MPSESGDMKLSGNFSKLIEFVSVNPDYNPANLSWKVAALNPQKAAALAAVADIGAREAPYKAAVNDRQDGFEKVTAGLISHDAAAMSHGHAVRRAAM